MTAAMPDRQPVPTPKRSSRSSRRPPSADSDGANANADANAEAEAETEASLVAGLTYNEARTALDLTLAALQASDLAVEEMAGLYRRASTYAERCRELLEGVEQEVIEWDETPQADG